MTRDYGPHLRVTVGGRVARITLDRQERLNAFAGDMRSDLNRALEDVASGACRVIVITGAGRAFSAGADVESLNALLEAGDTETFAGLVRAGMQVVRTIRSAPQLVIASVNGVAAGAGASLAAACDLRIASDAARIGFTFVRIGLHPDWGATYSLPRLVGAGRAAELFFSGRILAAAEAHVIGLFDRVVPAAALEKATIQWANELAEGGFEARAAAKATLHDGAKLDLSLDAELEAQLRCFGSDEVRASVGRFLKDRSDRNSTRGTDPEMG